MKDKKKQEEKENEGEREKWGRNWKSKGNNNLSSTEFGGDFF